jgi:hypothetical protein
MSAVADACVTDFEATGPGEWTTYGDIAGRIGHPVRRGRWARC